MAEVTLSIGGRDYAVACRDGEEAHLLKLGRMLDARTDEARRAVGGVNEPRQLLLAGLLLADELATATARADAAPAASDMLAERLEALADSIEKVAAGLEDTPARA